MSDFRIIRLVGEIDLLSYPSQDTTGTTGTTKGGYRGESDKQDKTTQTPFFTQKVNFGLGLYSKILIIKILVIFGN